MKISRKRLVPNSNVLSRPKAVFHVEAGLASKFEMGLGVSLLLWPFGKYISVCIII